MLTIKKILLPVNFERGSLSVVHQAAALARRFQSQIVMLHVVTPLSYSLGMLEGDYVPKSREDLFAELIRQAERCLDQYLRPELEGLAVQRLLRNGDPALEIVKAARDVAADLVALPTHGYGPFRRFLLGSVTSKVLHDSHCPVWTGAHIEEQSTTAFTVGNILCALDLSDHSCNTLSFAAQMAAAFKARLTLAHIIADLGVYSVGGSPALAAWQETLASSASERIGQVQREMRTNAAVLVDIGDVPRTLNRMALAQKADVLVIGRNPSIGHLRGAGYGIIRESRVPVLSV